VLTSAEAREATSGNPHSFLHVVKAEIDLDPGLDPHDERVYARAGENFRNMIARGWLVRDPEPAFYVYRVESDGHSQTGILGAAGIDDYTRGLIRRHEHTRPAKELDRVRVGTAIRAHPGPVFLAYRGVPEIGAWVEAATARPPHVRLCAPDGVVHTLWVVDGRTDCEQLARRFGDVERGYIADGHHRAAAAVRVNAELAAAATRRGAAAPPSYFLAVYFPAEELRILPYDRIVRGGGDARPGEWIGRLQAAGFRVEATAEARPHERGTFGMYLGAGRWVRLRPPGPVEASGDPVERLDVSILNERVLRSVFGIDDPRTDPRLDHAGGPDSLRGLEREVDSGRAVAAFALHATSIEDVLAVADADRVLPPKSTWFHPKLRSGLVVLGLEDDRL